MNLESNAKRFLNAANKKGSLKKRAFIFLIHYSDIYGKIKMT